MGFKVVDRAAGLSFSIKWGSEELHLLLVLLLPRRGLAACRASGSVEDALKTASPVALRTVSVASEAAHSSCASVLMKVVLSEPAAG